MASVKLQNVFKRFGDVTVVKDANLDIEEGDFVVLVGPSGCGKSTTLRMIAGLEELSEGHLQIGDRVVNDLSPRDRDVAMVFQSYALYPHMNVRDNISFGLKLRKMAQPEIDVRVKEAADILGLTDLLDRKPKQLSGGQRQRVAMGRAIVRKPSVFLFDEPLSNLDAKLRVAMRAEIAKLHQKLGVTTVYVTHDQVEAMTLAKHIVVMSEGIIQQVGAPLELYRNPANTFVAGFIGSPSMNFFNVELSGDKLHGNGFEIPVPERMKPRINGSSQFTMGIRPEDMFESGTQEATIPGRVDVLEPLGADVHALGESEGTAFTARLEPDTKVKVGDTLHMGLQMDALHLFDRNSGQSILTHKAH